MVGGYDEGERYSIVEYDRLAIRNPSPSPRCWLCRQAASCRQVIVVGRDLKASSHVRHYYIRSEVFEENYRAQNFCGMLEAPWNDPWKWMCGTDVR
jgi:hypothetical protein